ncbi:MAG TPA: YceI family protein [Acidimicrobiia bacterium]|nr:YceI family protein [Acidimicrobiia bacterium]
MNVKPGTYNLGPADGTVRVKTGRQGMASKVGHDLTLEASNWKATLTVDGDPSRSEVSATIEPRSLAVTAATGGAKPVSDKDKKDIVKNITGLLGNASITFTSTSVEVKDSSVKAAGELSIAGQSRPVTLDLATTPDGRLKGSMTVVQSQFGIKPFSAMMGALKVKDEVEVNLDVALPVEAS